VEAGAAPEEVMVVTAATVVVILEVSQLQRIPVISYPPYFVLHTIIVSPHVMLSFMLLRRP